MQKKNKSHDAHGVSSSIFNYLPPCYWSLLTLTKAYPNWIHTWLNGRRAYIEINGQKSRWFYIREGCPQGSILSRTQFITYHADMNTFLGSCLSRCFTDDLIAFLVGNIGTRYTSQCLNLERKLSGFFERLEYYTALTQQPINIQETEAIWSARAIGARTISHGLENLNTSCIG